MALISKSAIELELQETLPAAYTEDVIGDYSDEAEDNVKLATSRDTFTGSSATVYKRAVLLAICMRIGASTPSMLHSNISSMSEFGDSISYRTGDGYKTEYKEAIKRLSLSPISATSEATTNDETFF